MDFVVIDVETANQDPSSICQVAIASFRFSRMVEVWETLVNPESVFLSANIQIHGIRPDKVVKAPTWPEVRDTVRELFHGRIVASYTDFDRRALAGADQRYGLETVEVLGWVDTCAIARAAWPHLANHKLSHVARFLGLRHSPHDAKEDARCAGEILLRGAKALNLRADALLDAQSVRFRLPEQRSY